LITPEIGQYLIPPMDNMATMDSTTKYEDEGMMYIPKDVRESLKRYAYSEKKRMDNPLIAEMITWKSLTIKILRNEVQKRGHYVGVKKV
jgi:hypothetical protein